jgi:hypothetical protein
MFGWFLTVYQAVYDVGWLFLFIASRLIALSGDHSLLLLGTLLVFVLPLIIPRIVMNYFVKVYGTNERPIRKNHVYLFSYLLGIGVLFLQLWAVYSL